VLWIYGAEDTDSASVIDADDLMTLDVVGIDTTNFTNLDLSLFVAEVGIATRWQEVPPINLTSGVQRSIVLYLTNFPLTPIEASLKTL